MKTVKNIRLISTWLIYSANAFLQAGKKLFYTFPGQVDRFPRQAEQLYKSILQQYTVSKQLFRQAKLLVNHFTEQIRQPGEPINSIKEPIKSTGDFPWLPDLLQFYFFAQEKTTWRIYNAVTILCIAGCRQLLQLQGNTSLQLRLAGLQVAKCRLYANDNTAYRTHCRPP